MHILNTQSVSLDEVEEAIDLEQSPADCVVLSFSDSDLSALATAWSERAGTLPSLRLANLKKLRHPMSVDLYIDRVMTHAKVIIVRCLGGLDYWRYGLERIASVAKQNGARFVALPGDDRPDPRLTELSTEPAETIALFDRYFREGGVQNVAAALDFAAHLMGREATWQPPAAIPSIIAWSPSDGAVSPDKIHVTPDDKPAALIVFYRANVLAADTAPIAAVMKALKAEGVYAAALAVTSLKDPSIANDLADVINRLKPSVILNTTAFSAMRDDDTTILDDAGVPVLQVVLAGAAHDAWQESDRGLGASDLAMNVVLPELDGRLLTRAISFKEETVIDARLQHAGVRHVAVDDRVTFVAQLAANWAKLKRTPRVGRRVAIVLSDYPARAGRTGYAVGLDTPASVIELLKSLQFAGYRTHAPNNDTAELMSALEGAAQQIRIPLLDYRRWFADVPPLIREDVTHAWGRPEDDPRFDGTHFCLPCVRAGNITVLIQPDRGAPGDRKQSYHDTTAPPRHGYIALYAWLREHEKIHALIHLGTHGTLEWLPGKALALSGECCPEALLGPTPVIYPFIVNNPGEAVQAKRRLSAVAIGHLTPPLAEAGLNGPLADLESLIEEYAEADGVDRRRIECLEIEIIDRAWRSGLAEDCGVTKSDSPRDAIAKLDAQLCDIKDLAIRDGLHTFGRTPQSESCAQLCASIENAVRSGNGDLTRDMIEQRVASCGEDEQVALLAALDGCRIAPGPAGAPTRGRADVLPTGRNLTTTDPRAIPTRTANAIGKRAAQEIIRRYLQDHGEYPKSLFLDLWASASLRTGGDDLAQALTYLGVKPVWDTGSNRVTGIEVLPLAKLDHPRIDVTLRISGLFRDIFPTQIALFESAVTRVAALDEAASDNPLAAAQRRGEDLDRIFGGAPKTYGAGVAEVVLDGEWETEGDVAAAYINGASVAYGANEKTKAASDAFKSRIAAADALIHPQDDRERDILDTDGVADFVGGFAAAAKSLGNAPTLYHLDTNKPDAPKSRAFDEEIARIVRGRLTNPRWIAGMLKHGHRGVSEIAQSIDALYAFAATTNAAPSHLFDAVDEALFANEAIASQMAHANSAATGAIAQRLRDAIARHLWVPRRNAVYEDLERIAHNTKNALEAAQ